MTPEILGTAPDETIKWVTSKEAEEFDRMMFKNYVRVDPKSRTPVKDSKDYFYKIIGSHPSSPADRTTTDEEFLIVFEVQKFYRNKTRKARVNRGGGDQWDEVEQNEPVKSHTQNAKGNWILVDGDASFMCEARKFKQEFAPDNT